MTLSVLSLSYYSFFKVVVDKQKEDLQLFQTKEKCHKSTTNLEIKFLNNELVFFVQFITEKNLSKLSRFNLSNILREEKFKKFPLFFSSFISGWPMRLQELQSQDNLSDKNTTQEIIKNLSCFKTRQEIISTQK